MGVQGAANPTLTTDGCGSRVRGGRPTPGDGLWTGQEETIGVPKCRPGWSHSRSRPRYRQTSNNGGAAGAVREFKVSEFVGVVYWNFRCVEKNGSTLVSRRWPTRFTWSPS